MDIRIGLHESQHYHSYPLLCDGCCVNWIISVFQKEDVAIPVEFEIKGVIVNEYKFMLSTGGKIELQP